MYQVLLLTVYRIIFFATPLIIIPITSELFEFNKIVFIYIATVFAVVFWVLRMASERRIIFRRTIFDIPLLLFLAGQALSTLVSIDPRSSVFGYYSRFNGGLLSSISYSLLYWVFVSNIKSPKIISLFKYTVISGLLVSIYGILEHFGIDKDLWVQDVQTRVFSTLGQPNWLAAWLVAITPISWYLAFFQKQGRGNKNIIWLGVSAIFIVTLIFTKSRSGFIAFVVCDFAFGAGLFYIFSKQAKTLKNNALKKFIYTNLTILAAIALVGSPWTPSISDLVSKRTTTATLDQYSPALEVGGTESGTIRKIVWRGALDIFKHYPILGSGVETFGLSYYNFRPQEHNLVSEWDFIYNKAHNEYLNYLATTGALGTSFYLLLIFVYLYFSGKNIISIDKEPDTGKKILLLSLFCGYSSLLITNFFGFSVVVTSLLLFLIPAMSIVAISSPDKDLDIKRNTGLQKTDFIQKFIQISTLTAGGFLILTICKYWMADSEYNKGLSSMTIGSYSQARGYFVKSIDLVSKEPTYWVKLSQSTADIALTLPSSENQDTARKISEEAVNESLEAQRLSPNNVNVLRSLTATYINLSSINPDYIQKAKDAILQSIKLAPNDPKFYYNLGLIYIQTQQQDEGIKTLEKSIELKSNYKEPRLALGLIYANLGENAKAEEQFKYVLEHIDPKEPTAIQKLSELQK